MEDILFIMYTENKSLPSYILEDGQYKLIGDYNDPIRNDVRSEVEDNSIQIILPIESILDNKYLISSDGVIEYRNRFCSCCSSKKIHKKGYAWTKIYLEKGIPLKVKVKRYYCRHCFKWTQTEFIGFYEKYTGFPGNLAKMIRNIRGNSWVSLRKIKKIIKDLIGIDISHETIRSKLLVDGEFYYLNEDIKLSGYYSYDEQWERVDGKWIYYYVLFDIVNRVPVATYLSDSLSNDEIKNFINMSIPYKDRIAIITDLKSGYDKIMRELGFVHQHCIFHLLQRIWDHIFKYIDAEIIEYSNKLKNSKEKLSPTEIKKMVNSRKKELKKEMGEYVNIFKKLFKQKDFNQAMDYISFLKSEMNKFPKFLADYLNKNFFPEHRKFLHFLEKEHYGKLEATNNRLENYNKITMPRYEKRFYRTKRGLWSTLMHKKDVWTKNRKKEHST